MQEKLLHRNTAADLSLLRSDRLQHSHTDDLRFWFCTEACPVRQAVIAVYTIGLYFLHKVTGLVPHNTPLSLRCSHACHFAVNAAELAVSGTILCEGPMPSFQGKGITCFDRLHSTNT